MCDTFAANTAVTKDGSIIFGKNSDRQPNEPHHILHIKGGKTDSKQVNCTYISIPQVDEVNEVLLSKPNWIWGAEMGANQHGVVIGNEAVWTTEQKNDEALIGMDLLRLGLERGSTAVEALDVITKMLETHGQGGNHGFAKKEYYDNSFVIADPNEAWILETAGRFWIAEKVKTIRTISNCLTIENDYDKIHPDLIDYAIDKGKCDSKDDFNFREQFTNKYHIVRIGAKGDKRRACTLDILEKESGKITPMSAMKALRSHNTDNDHFNPRNSSMASPCVHASSLLTPAQSTASMVSHVTKNHQIYWLTGTSAPCISIFKPMILGGKPYNFPELHNTYTAETLWWEHEILHRQTIQNYADNKNIYEKERQEFENSLLNEIYSGDSLQTSTSENIEEISHKSFEKNLSLISKWRDELQTKQNKSNALAFRYNRYWSKLNKKAKLPKPI